MKKKKRKKEDQIKDAPYNYGENIDPWTRVGI